MFATGPKRVWPKWISSKRICIVFAAVALAACSGSEPSLDDAIALRLDSVATFPGAAERMLPGARAAMQVEATVLGREVHDVVAVADAALTEWELRLQQCESNPNASLTPARTVDPPNDGSWTSGDVPESAFRPLDEEWAVTHRLSGMDEAAVFAQYPWLEEQLPTSECIDASFPFQSALQGVEGVETPYDIALELSQRMPLPSDRLTQNWQGAQGTFGTNNLAGGSWDTCMIEAGFADLLAADFFEQRAQFGLSVEAATADARCWEMLFTPIDDEVLELAGDFATSNEAALFDPEPFSNDGLLSLAD